MGWVNYIYSEKNKIAFEISRDIDEDIVHSTNDFMVLFNELMTYIGETAEIKSDVVEYLVKKIDTSSNDELLYHLTFVPRSPHP